MESNVLPVAPYFGGKRILSSLIIARIMATEHTAYGEPFVGMGGVFLRRPRRAAAESINDVSRDVSNLFRIIQRHYTPFIEMLRYQVTARAEFERLAGSVADTLTDLERAARFLYLQRLAYGGKVTGRHFAPSPLNPGRFDVTRLVPMLDALHERLAGVTIECLDYRKYLEKYDREQALFYIDPPYWGHESDYGKGVFGRDDFAVLAGILGSLKGKFILSINDRPEIRALFAAFHIEEVMTTYTTNGRKQKAKAARELIISNTR